MLWYFLLLLIICLDFGLEWLLKNKNIIKEDNSSKLSKVLTFIFKYRVLTIFAMVFLSTFKAMSVGADSPNYAAYYERLMYNKELRFKSYIGSKFEFGYTFIYSIFAMMNIPFRVILFLTSLFISIVLVLFVNKISTNKFMSIILYVALGVFAQSLNLVRQIIAMGFLLLAIMKLLDKKWLPACLLIVAGALFHISILCSLVVVPLIYIKPNWKIVLGAFLITIVGSFVLPEVLRVLEYFTPLDYYTRYFVKWTHFIHDSNLLNTLYSCGLIALFFVLWIAKFKLLKLDENEMKLYDFFLLIFLFVPLFRIAGIIVRMPELFNRLNMNFFIALLVLIPLFVKGLKFNKKLFIAANISVYVVAFVYMYYLYAIKLSCEVVPYAFCF